MKYILYIEDNPEQLELVQHLLETRLGVTVEVCCTSRGAEGFLNHRCYDVVICDVALPGELGIDIAEKILERDPQQPIYLMSEYTGSKFQLAARAIGLELHRKFSQKEPAEFVEDIRKLLDQRPCAAEISPGALGESAATRGNDCDRSRDEDVTNGYPAAEISRPLKAIRLTSPHVLAARASLA